MAAFEQLPWLQITPSNFLEAAVQGSHASLQRRAQDLENAQSAARNAVSLAQIQAERDKSMAEAAVQDQYNKARLNQGEQRIGIGQQNADSHTQNANTHSGMADLAVDKFKTATDQKAEVAANHAKVISAIQAGKALKDIPELEDLPPSEANSALATFKILHPKAPLGLTPFQQYTMKKESGRVLSIPGAETNFPTMYNDAKAVHDNLDIPNADISPAPSVGGTNSLSPTINPPAPQPAYSLGGKTVGTLRDADLPDDAVMTIGGKTTRGKKTIDDEKPKFSYVRDKSGNLVLQ